MFCWLILSTLLLSYVCITGEGKGKGVVCVAAPGFEKELMGHENIP